MREMKLRVQVLRPAGASEWRTWSLAIGRRDVITMLGCHCRKGKPQCKYYARGVTAGKMGRNSSLFKHQTGQCFLISCLRLNLFTK